MGPVLSGWDKDTTTLKSHKGCHTSWFQINCYPSPSPGYRPEFFLSLIQHDVWLHCGGKNSKSLSSKFVLLNGVITINRNEDFILNPHHSPKNTWNWAWNNRRAFVRSDKKFGVARTHGKWRFCCWPHCIVAVLHIIIAYSLYSITLWNYS